MLKRREVIYPSHAYTRHVGRWASHGVAWVWDHAFGRSQQYEFNKRETPSFNVQWGRHHYGGRSRHKDEISPSQKFDHLVDVQRSMPLSHNLQLSQMPRDPYSVPSLKLYTDTGMKKPDTLSIASVLERSTDGDRKHE